MTFERSYNAQDTATGALGQGWTHNYAMRLLITSDVVTLVAPHGSRIPFYKDGSTFVPAPGVRAHLTLSGGVYTLKQGDDVTYTFNSSGRLLTLGDGRGNTTTLVYSGDAPVRVVAPDGRALILAYTSGLITSVTDPLGRSVLYGYTNSRLTAVQDRRGQA